MSVEATPVPAHFLRDRTTWLCYVLLLYYSYIINILGPLTPFLRAELTLTYTLASLHMSAFAAGMLLAGITADRVVGRLGRRTTLWTGAFGMALGMLALLAGHQPAVTIPACFMMGSVGSLILAVYPAVLAGRHGRLAAVAYTEANILGSTAAAAAPLILGLMAHTQAGWRAALLLPALALGPMFLAYRTEPLAAAPQAGQAQHATKSPGTRLPAAYWAFWVVIVLVVSVEFCTAFWAADFVKSERGLAAADAALAVTIFLGGMLVGRAVGSRLLRRYPAKALVLASLAVTGIGFLLFWLIGDLRLGALGLFVEGLGVANLYPASLGLAMGAAPGQPDQASARASLASGTAIIALPLLLGRIADAVGMTPAFGLVGVLTVLAAALLVGVSTLRRMRGNG